MTVDIKPSPSTSSGQSIEDAWAALFSRIRFGGSLEDSTKLAARLTLLAVLDEAGIRHLAPAHDAALRAQIEALT